MGNGESIANLFTAQGFSQVMGWGVLFLLSVYTLFAFITIRQVALMNSNFKTEIAPFFTFIAYAHFFASLGLLIIGFIALL